MKTVYPSKIGIFLIIFLMIVAARTLDQIFTTEFDAVLYGMYMFVLLFLVILISGVRYIIDGTQLIVSVAGIYRKRYDIMRITEIKPTHSIISAPACSIDRLKIHCGGKSLIISPKRKAEFIKHIQKINPNVKITM